MHLVAFLPRNLLTHLRVVLGDVHSLGAARDSAELHAMLRSGQVDVLVVDPAMQDGALAPAIEETITRNPGLPVVVYTMLAPAAMRLVVRLGRLGVQHVVLNRFDDEPRRFLELLERVPAQPLAELMLQELEEALRSMPIVVARAVEQLFRSPARVRDTRELADMAGMIPRTLYRQLTPLELQPRHLLTCARLLRAYVMLRDTDVLLKQVATKLGYADPHAMTEQMREWTGLGPREVRALDPPQFVRRLANHLRLPAVRSEDEVQRA